MPTLLDRNNSSQLLPSAKFASEAELESLLIRNPGLLVIEGDPAAEVVKNQLDLGDVGILDILLVDKEGLPIVVEVKLARNGESRREVVAQAIDYVSALTLLSFDEIDEEVNGKLDLVLRSFPTAFSENSQAEFETRRRDFNLNLRSGAVRFVLVLDEAPDDLKRIMDFLSERSNLDVRLFVVGKHPDSMGNTVYVSHLIVSSNNSAEAVVKPGPTQPAFPDLQKVIEAYDVIASPGLTTRGKASNYRQIRPKEWIGGMHYEFLTRPRDGVTAEIHLESHQAKSLAPTLQGLIAQLADQFPLGTFVWDPSWSSNKGRVALRLGPNAAPEIVAGAMKKLIELTLSQITNEVIKLKSSQETSQLE